MALPAFSSDEKALVHQQLALRVIEMRGRKFEEGDWEDVYKAAKGIPGRKWSNLNIDIAHNELGVEQKMLKIEDRKDLLSLGGTSRMHPAATRSLRPGDLARDANIVMKDVLEQYGELINDWSEWVREQSKLPKATEIDLRTGLLLWKDSLSEFLYFEEPLVPPHPNEYYAVWNESQRRGARKPSRSLWIYEKKTDRKRFSLTTDAGVKLQPYYDIPPATDPHLYHFKVIGEVVEAGRIRVWLTQDTADKLQSYFKYGDHEELDAKLGNILEGIEGEFDDLNQLISEDMPKAVPVVLSETTYTRLTSIAPAVNDDVSMQILIDYLLARSTP